MKKQFIYGVATALLLSAASCGDRLELQPQQQIDASVALNTAQDLESAIIGAYGQITATTTQGLAGGSLYGTNLLLLPELLAAENYVTWRGTFSSYREASLKTMTSTNAEAERTWLAAYQTINAVNNVLASLDVVGDAQLRGRLEGEARFIRGILFFELVRLYALPWSATADNTQPGVPLVLTPNRTIGEASTTVARSTVAQTYTQVIADLNQAVTLLPADNGTRADQNAARAFLGRVYLQQGNYAQALSQMNQVVGSNLYRLNPSVTAAFRNRNTAESIFEIQQNDQNNAGTANDGLTTFYSSQNINGVTVGRGDVQVNNAFANTYAASDARRTELLYTGVKGGGTRLYSAKYTDFAANIPVVRLAELLLVRAECNLRLGSTTGATPATDLNAVRTRAGAAPIAAPTLDDVLQERRLELAFEGQRIHDVKRLRQTITRRNSDGTVAAEFAWSSPRLVLPIPQREIDANSALTQNEGY